VGRSSLVGVGREKICLRSESPEKAAKKKGIRVRMAANMLGRVNIGGLQYRDRRGVLCMSNGSVESATTS